MGGTPPGSRIRVAEVLDLLRHALGSVTVEEFRRQETRYDLDSRLGRELLYLIANDEWVHTTTEIVDLQKAGTVDTTIRVEVNLDRITHEAFRERREQLWLPLLVLPPRRRGDGVARRLTAAVPAVTDAVGEVKSTLPQLQLRRWVSAALAEIMLNSGAAHGRGGTEPTVTREQRLLLSVAIWRTLLGHDPEARDAGLPADRARPHVPAGAEDTAWTGNGTQTAMTALLDGAREQVGELLDAFATALVDRDRPPVRRRGGGVAPPPERPESSTGLSPLLVGQVVEAIDAFADDAVVVAVAAPDRPGPTTFSVRLPDRPLRRRRLTRRPTPCARVELDLLAPSAHADRQVLIRLPTGTRHTADGPQQGPAATAEIRTTVPRALTRFLELWWQLPDQPPDELSAADRCLAGVALAQGDLAQDVFRYHAPADGTDLEPVFRQAHERLQRGQSPAGGGERVPEPDRQADDEALHRLVDDVAPLRRTARVEAVNPQAVLVRLDMIDNPVLRGGVESARVGLDVVAEDPDTLRTARFTGRMSLLILGAMGVGVLAVSSPDGQVLATLLTLFAAVQASRIEYPDRSSLRGLLTSISSWIVPLTIAPSVLLGVALAFFPGRGGQPTGPTPRLLGLTPTEFCWVIAFALQLVIQLVLELGPLTERSGALAPAGLPWRRRRPQPRAVLWTEPPPDHRRVSVLQGTWWRGTTAAALLLGRPAHAYLVPQESGAGLPQLLGMAEGSPDPAPRFPPLLRLRGRRDGQPVPGPGEDVPNILAMLRSGTVQRSLTFVVLREEPRPEWIHGNQARGFELSPDRLIPSGSPAGLVDVFLGLPRGVAAPVLPLHPVRGVLAAVAAEGWRVAEIQLPVPAPPGGGPGRRWLRVRVALEEDDLRDLGRFLDGLTRRVRDSGAGLDLELLVRSAPQVRPERFHPPAAADAVPRGQRHPIQASELDVLDLTDQAPDAAEWNVVGVCGYARTGIESTLLDWLGQQRPALRLAGLTATRLYGTTVVFLLGHQSGGARAGDRRLVGMIPHHEDDLAEVLHDSWVSGTELGVDPGPGDGRVLQVHVQSRDLPGTLSEVLGSLRGALTRLVLRHQDGARVDLAVWHLRLEVAEGQVARCRFTLRLPEELSATTTQWGAAEWERARRLMEREVRQALTARLRSSGLDLHGDPADLVDTVMSTRLVRVEVADETRAAASRPGGPDGSAAGGHPRRPSPAGSGTPAGDLVDLTDAQPRQRATDR